MRALVIGYGSIGQRHARLLSQLGCDVAVVSRREIDFRPRYKDLATALADWRPGYVVVANKTQEHFQEIDTLARCGFGGFVLIEKPLFADATELPRHGFSRTAVAYNLRCHPILARLKSFLKNAGNLVTASVYVGSYLPHWRPNTDYRQSYSARRSEGGGVLRDLSHELDYVLWLFGSWRRMTAIGGHLSSLEIHSDDAYSLLMETEHCPLVSIHMNYLDRAPHREVRVNTWLHTVRADLIENTLTIDGFSEAFSVARDDTYITQHEAMMSGRGEGLCSLEEAMETLLTIEAAERASRSQTWIVR